MSERQQVRFYWIEKHFVEPFENQTSSKNTLKHLDQTLPQVERHKQQDTQIHQVMVVGRVFAD
jgi:hypothetical protein